MPFNYLSGMILGITFQQLKLTPRVCFMFFLTDNEHYYYMLLKNVYFHQSVLEMKSNTHP